MIPTGVGNILGLEIWSSWLGFHPHWCGEHPESIQYPLSPLGSSPLVWGTLAVVWLRVFIARFIPTGVGNMHNG